MVPGSSSVTCEWCGTEHLGVEPGDRLYCRCGGTVCVSDVSPERLTVFADGSSRGNPGPAGVGVVVLDGEGEEVAHLSEPLGVATNNVAEWRSLIRGLELGLAHRPLSLRVCLDSRLVVQQVNGRWRVKDPRLARFHRRALELLGGHTGRVQVVRIPRELNVQADELATLASLRSWRAA